MTVGADDTPVKTKGGGKREEADGVTDEEAL